MLADSLTELFNMQRGFHPIGQDKAINAFWEIHLWSIADETRGSEHLDLYGGFRDDLTVDTSDQRNETETAYDSHMQAEMKNKMNS